MLCKRNYTYAYTLQFLQEKLNGKVMLWQRQYEQKGKTKIVRVKKMTM